MFHFIDTLMRLRYNLAIVLVWSFTHGLFFASTPIYTPNDTTYYKEIADVLQGQQAFGLEAFYYPPGYAIVIAIARTIFSDPDVALVVLQHVAILLIGLMLLHLGALLQKPLVGLLAGVLVVLNPALLHWSHVLYTEIFTSLALVLAAFCTARAVVPGSRSTWWVILVGVALAWAGLARTVPYALSVPVAFYLFGNRRQFTIGRRRILPYLPVIICTFTYCGWCLYMYRHSGRFCHTHGAGLHIYNRVVYTDGTLSRDSPHTAQLLSVITEQEALRPHWDVYASLKSKGLASREAADLMTNVSKEALLERPFKYLLNTVRLFLRYWFQTPERLLGVVSAPPLVPGLRTFVDPIVTLLTYLTGHRALGAMALVGAACALRNRIPLLTLVLAIVVIYNGGHAAGEWASLRFGIPCYPFLALLGAWGICCGGQVLSRDSSKSS